MTVDTCVNRPLPWFPLRRAGITELRLLHSKHQPCRTDVISSVCLYACWLINLILCWGGPGLASDTSPYGKQTWGSSSAAPCLHPSKPAGCSTHAQRMQCRRMHAARHSCVAQHQRRSLVAITVARTNVVQHNGHEQLRFGSLGSAQPILLTSRSCLCSNTGLLSC